MTLALRYVSMAALGLSLVACNPSAPQVPAAQDTQAHKAMAPQSPDTAVAVVTRYYAALNAHDYATAWTQWGDKGPPHQSLAQFASGFAHTRSTHVTTGTLPPAEGAAGSIYQTVPVIVDAVRDDGHPQRFVGNYVIRRVNGVDGATPDQLRWHIDQAHLSPAT